LLAVAVAMAAGCSQSDMMKAMVPPADQQAAAHYVDLLRQHQFDPIETDLDSSLQTSDIHAALVRLATLFPAQDPISVKLVGANIFHSPGIDKKSISLEYQFSSRWLLVSVATRGSGRVMKIYGLHVNVLPDSLENINRFALGGKGLSQYAVMALAVIALTFTLLALVVCIRTRIAKRKWLWIIFILVGFGKLSVNWTTGHLDFMPASIQLFSASTFSQLYGPWFVAVSFPLGAAWFLSRRKFLIADAVPPALPDSRSSL